MGLRAVIARPFNAIYGKYTAKVKLVNDHVERVRNSFKLPERFKGTIVESDDVFSNDRINSQKCEKPIKFITKSKKIPSLSSGRTLKVIQDIKGVPTTLSSFKRKWAEYWTAVCKDYTEAVVGIVTEVRDKPIKGVSYISAATAAYYCANRNPTELDFRNTLLSHCNDFIFVGPNIRNPETAKHLKTLEKCYNEGIVKRQSFGVFSIMWVDNFRDDVGAYKATCQYMTPDILSFHTRIVDVGFLDRWWILEKKMVDCDINPEEWVEETKG